MGFAHLEERAMKKKLTGKLQIHRETLTTLTHGVGLGRVVAGSESDACTLLLACRSITCPSHYFACLHTAEFDCETF
jgi:hypothetical protein